MQRRGVIEITDLDAQSRVFEKMDTQQSQSLFEKNISVVRQALETLSFYAKEKKGMFSMLEGREELTLGEYEDAVSLVPESMKAANRLTALAREIAENKAEILRLETQIDALSPWLSLDVSMRLKGTKRTRVFIGTPVSYTHLDVYKRQLQERGRDARAVPPVSESN